MGKMPCLLPPHVLENRGGRGLAGGGLGPVVQGARVAGIVGKKEVEARGFDSPLQFRSMGPVGVGAAAMVAADELRPWAARVGAARGEWSWGKGRGGR